MGTEQPGLWFVTTGFSLREALPDGSGRVWAALGFPGTPLTTLGGNEGCLLSAGKGSLWPGLGHVPTCRLRGVAWVRPASPEPYGPGAKQGTFPQGKGPMFFSAKGDWRPPGRKQQMLQPRFRDPRVPGLPSW